jgi:Raf kinase inhibitor-like YbhB/YbcL family protein
MKEPVKNCGVYSTISGRLFFMNDLIAVIFYTGIFLDDLKIKLMNSNTLIITSEAFTDGGDIPSYYTCEGAGVNPPLQIDGIPVGTITLALIAEDPDAPKGTFDHWLLWNLPPDIMLEEDRRLGMTGTNSGGKTGYYPPCPPSGTHRYFFHVFALDKALDIDNGASRSILEEAMASHILAKGSIMGRYKKQGKANI